MNMPDQILAAMLAGRFAAEMKSELTAAELRQVRERNASGDYAGACATHDFCDANMMMHSAFVAVVGVDPHDDGMSEEHCELWNEAWNIAKREHLTATS